MGSPNTKKSKYYKEMADKGLTYRYRTGTGRYQTHIKDNAPSYSEWKKQEIVDYNQLQQRIRERRLDKDRIKSRAYDGTVYYKVGLSDVPQKTSVDNFLKLRKNAKDAGRYKILDKNRYEHMIYTLEKQKGEVYTRREGGKDVKYTKKVNDSGRIVVDKTTKRQQQPTKKVSAGELGLTGADVKKIVDKKGSADKVTDYDLYYASAKKMGVSDPEARAIASGKYKSATIGRIIDDANQKKAQKPVYTQKEIKKITAEAVKQGYKPEDVRVRKTKEGYTVSFEKYQAPFAKQEPKGKAKLTQVSSTVAPGLTILQPGLAYVQKQKKQRSYSFYNINNSSTKAPTKGERAFEERIKRLTKWEKAATKRHEKAEKPFKQIPGLKGDLGVQKFGRDVLAAPSRYTVGLAENVALSFGKAAATAEGLFRNPKGTWSEMGRAAKKTPITVTKGFSPIWKEQGAWKFQPESTVNLMAVGLGTKGRATIRKPVTRNTIVKGKQVSQPVRSLKVGDKYQTTYSLKTGKGGDISLYKTAKGAREAIARDTHTTVNKNTIIGKSPVEFDIIRTTKGISTRARKYNTLYEKNIENRPLGGKKISKIKQEKIGDNKFKITSETKYINKKGKVSKPYSYSKTIKPNVRVGKPEKTQIKDSGLEILSKDKGVQKQGVRTITKQTSEVRLSPWKKQVTTDISQLDAYQKGTLQLGLKETTRKAVVKGQKGETFPLSKKGQRAELIKGRLKYPKDQFTIEKSGVDLNRGKQYAIVKSEKSPRLTKQISNFYKQDNLRIVETKSRLPDYAKSSWNTAKSVGQSTGNKIIGFAEATGRMLSSKRASLITRSKLTEIKAGSLKPQTPRTMPSVASSISYASILKPKAVPILAPVTQGKIAESQTKQYNKPFGRTMKRTISRTYERPFGRGLTKTLTKSMTKVNPFQRTRTKTKTRTQTKQLSQTKTKTLTETGTISFFPRSSITTTQPSQPPPDTPTLPLPKIKFGSDKVKGVKKEGDELDFNQVKNYKPSLYAVFGNIKGKSSKGGVLSGLGVRPIKG